MGIEYANELHTVHEVKVALCYLLAKIDSRITEQELYAIIFNSEFINYFLYAAALEELIINDSIARVIIDNEYFIEIRDKGREAADVLKKTVQFRFRKHLLEAAYNYTAERTVKNTVSVTTEKIKNGCNVIATIGDSTLELMKISLYAPDEDQAEYLSFQIRENPTEFYRTIINTLLMSKRPEIEIDENAV